MHNIRIRTSTTTSTSTATMGQKDKKMTVPVRRQLQIPASTTTTTTTTSTTQTQTTISPAVRNNSRRDSNNSSRRPTTRSNSNSSPITRSSTSSRSRNSKGEDRADLVVSRTSRSSSGSRRKRRRSVQSPRKAQQQQHNNEHVQQEGTGGDNIDSPQQSGRKRGRQTLITHNRKNGNSIHTTEDNNNKQQHRTVRQRGTVPLRGTGKNELEKVNNTTTSDDDDDTACAIDDALLFGDESNHNSGDENKGGEIISNWSAQQQQQHEQNRLTDDRRCCHDDYESNDDNNDKASNGTCWSTPRQPRPTNGETREGTKNKDNKNDILTPESWNSRKARNQTSASSSSSRAANMLSSTNISITLSNRNPDKKVVVSNKTRSNNGDCSPTTTRDSAHLTLYINENTLEINSQDRGIDTANSLIDDNVDDDYTYDLKEEDKDDNHNSNSDADEKKNKSRSPIESAAAGACNGTNTTNIREGNRRRSLRQNQKQRRQPQPNNDTTLDSSSTENLTASKQPLGQTASIEDSERQISSSPIQDMDGEIPTRKDEKADAGVEAFMSQTTPTDNDENGEPRSTTTNKRSIRIRKPVVNDFVAETLSTSAHRVRCKKCIACSRTDCGTCYACVGKTKFGGDGKSRQSRDACIYRRCHLIYPPLPGEADNYDNVKQNMNFYPASTTKTGVGNKSNTNQVELEKITSKAASVAERRSKNGKNDHSTKKAPAANTSSSIISTKNSLNDKNTNASAAVGTNTSKKVVTIKPKPQPLSQPDRGYASSSASYSYSFKDPSDKPSASITRKQENNDNSTNFNTMNESTIKIQNKGALSEFMQLDSSNCLYCTSKRGRDDIIDTSWKPPFNAQQYIPKDDHEADVNTADNNNRNSSTTHKKHVSMYGCPILTDPASNMCAGCRGEMDPPPSDVDEDTGIYNSDDVLRIKTMKNSNDVTKNKKNRSNTPPSSSKNSESFEASTAQCLETTAIPGSLTESSSEDSSEISDNKYHHKNNNASTVILCDGINCGREYHLGCCTPALIDVPDSNYWFCQDCCPHNTTASLIQYFEAAHEARAAYHLEQEPRKRELKSSSYVLHLLKKDSSDLGLTDDCLLPISELERSGRTNALALIDPEELAKHPLKVPSEALSADKYLGKPIRLYNSISNQYHTGRIVDYRSAYLPSEANMTDRDSENKNDAAVTATAATGDNDTLSYHDAEFLVRFAAGKDDRKTKYYHWIVLEEHSLAVGLTFVWARFQSRWQPSILFLRTARELVPVQHILNAEKGEIFYQSRTGESVSSDCARGCGGDSATSNSSAQANKKAKRKAWTLVRSFGQEEYALIDAKHYACDFTNPEAIRMYKTEGTILQYEVAESERLEQERVKKWCSMKRAKYMGPAALSSQDWYSLSPLIPKNNYLPDISNSKRHAALCPNIQLGLDRSLILRLLETKTGIVSTKDVSSSLACNLVKLRSKHIVRTRKKYHA